VLALCILEEFRKIVAFRPWHRSRKRLYERVSQHLGLLDGELVLGAVDDDGDGSIVGY